jgi:hypothetical protein
LLWAGAETSRGRITAKVTIDCNREKDKFIDAAPMLLTRDRRWLQGLYRDAAAPCG